MRKEIYLKNFDINDNYILNNLSDNPHQASMFFKDFLEKTYPDYIKEIKDAINSGAEIIHIKNASKQNYNVLTPYNGEVEVTGIEDLICHMYGIIGAIDSLPILYKDEDKNIIRAVAPRYNSHNERSSQSPFNDLDWHVDAAYRPMLEKANNLSPIVDYLIFGVVHKGHENLPIVYISLKDILNRLSYDDILVGLSKEFTIMSADSFLHKISVDNMPLLVEYSTGYYSRIKMDVIAETQKVQGFLNKIREIVDQKSIQNHIYVNPGDIVILNNKMILHKRDKYTPKWDGKDRYFTRIYAVKDIKQGVLADPDKPWIWI
ncbi:cephalosporin hydroxylase [Rickettsia bellii]|uniref:Taurine catabolism dioxygenase TauD, TfdA family protein n=1 Tax=Rickettsia bellii str. RML An4 TaxID=1359193 RepID=A0A0F3Q9T6_RICBE|nr:TauD/TfdA family dioxygenase [Rickettsia bellii]ARD86914.1 cephalosporin hydroxylase [Rickettsia bellii]KJV89335.1 taurine catabolism dioxygenase TauD, TfdA family protein [Rickettsia bellii str. RML An4]